jgi:hypothetical protein
VKRLPILLVVVLGAFGALSTPTYAQETEPAPPLFREPTAQFPETARRTKSDHPPPAAGQVHLGHVRTTWVDGRDARAAIGQLLDTPPNGTGQEGIATLRHRIRRSGDQLDERRDRTAGTRIRPSGPASAPGAHRRFVHALISPVAPRFRDGSPHFSYAAGGNRDRSSCPGIPGNRRARASAARSPASGSTWRPPPV